MIYATDTETNGREPAEVIELACVPVKAAEWVWDGQSIFEQRYKPQNPSTWTAYTVHGILPSVLEGCAPSKEAKLLADADYMIGHNVDYDWKALGEPQVKRICTLAIARHLYPDDEGHGLGAMLLRLNGFAEFERIRNELHGANNDALACLEVLRGMLLFNKLEFSTAEALWHFSELARIPTICDFGKYRGKRYEDIPPDYKYWYLRQKDKDPYIEQAMRNTL